MCCRTHNLNVVPSFIMPILLLFFIILLTFAQGMYPGKYF